MLGELAITPAMATKSTAWPVAYTTNPCTLRPWFFVLIILYSLYLEYDSPLIPSASGLAG
jgi:hypothetical protein